MTEFDLQRALESSFKASSGSEPLLPSPRARVVAGRRALRRRRVLTGLVAAAAVSGVVWGSAQMITTDVSGPTPIEQPTSAPSSQRVPLLNTSERALTLPARVDHRWRDSCGHAHQPSCHRYSRSAAPVGINADGTLWRTRSNVIIVRQAHDTTPKPGSQTIEVEVRTAESIRVQWWVLTRAAGEVTAKVADPASSLIDFATWAHAVNNDIAVAGTPRLTVATVLPRS